MMVILAAKHRGGERGTQKRTFTNDDDSPDTHV